MINLNWNTNSGYGFWDAVVTVGSGETSDFVRLNYDATTSVAVFPSSGGDRAKCQYTLTKIDEVSSGNGRWLDWPKGTVNGNAVGESDTIVGVVTAVRLVSVNGPATMEVIAR